MGLCSREPWPLALAGALGLALCVGAAPHRAKAQVMPIADRTDGLLASCVSTRRIYMLRDLNDNGSSNGPNETRVFFDASNRSNIVAEMVIESLEQDAQGRVFAADSKSRAVYVLHDRNGNGDAQDPGEARIWFNAANASQIPVGLVTGLAIGPDGAVYISVTHHIPTSANLTGVELRGAIIRTFDLNGDGSANGPGEASVWATLDAVGSESTPADAAWLDGALWVADLRGSLPDVLLRLKDENHSDHVEPESVRVFAEEGRDPIHIAFSCTTDGHHLYIHNNGSANLAKRIYRLRDDNNDGLLQTGERTEIWHSSRVPQGIRMGNSFAIALGPDGVIAISSNGTDEQDWIAFLKDTNGDGIISTSEFTLWHQGGRNASGLDTIRAMTFYKGPCAPPSPNDLFDFLSHWFAQHPSADLDGNGSVGVNDLFLFVANWFQGC